MLNLNYEFPTLMAYCFYRKSLEGKPKVVRFPKKLAGFKHVYEGLTTNNLEMKLYSKVCQYVDPQMRSIRIYLNNMESWLPDGIISVLALGEDQFKIAQFQKITNAKCFNSFSTIPAIGEMALQKIPFPWLKEKYRIILENEHKILNSLGIPRTP